MSFQAQPALRRLLKRATHPAAVIALTVLLILPLLYIARYDHPSSDDYGNALWTNYFDAQARLYTGWTGRYFSSLIISLNPIHWHSFIGYRIAVCALIVLFCLSFFALIDKMLSAGTLAPRRTRTIVAAAAVILLLNNLISLTEGFYWFCGAMTYTLSAILFSWFLMMVINLDRNPGMNPSAGRYVLAVALLACTIGSNEIIMVLADVVCCCLFLYYGRRKQHGLTRLYLLLCVVCALCSAAAVLAPGNRVRQPGAYGHLLVALPSWIYFSKELFLEWITDPFLLLFSVLFLFFMRRYSLRKTAPGRLLMAFLMPLLIILLLCFPGFWVLGRMPPARALNIAYIFFSAGWIFFLLNLSAHLQTFWYRQSAESAVLRQLLCIAIGIALLADFSMQRIRASNYFILAKNFARHIPQAYDTEMMARYAAIKTASTDTVVVPPILHKRGNILYFADLSTDPDVFPNTVFATYWGKAKILRTADTSVQRPQ